MFKSLTLKIEIEDDFATVGAFVDGKETSEWFGLPSSVNEGVSILVKSFLSDPSNQVCPEWFPKEHFKPSEFLKCR